MLRIRLFLHGPGPPTVPSSTSASDSMLVPSVWIVCSSSSGIMSPMGYTCRTAVNSRSQWRTMAAAVWIRPGLFAVLRVPPGSGSLLEAAWLSICVAACMKEFMSPSGGPLCLELLLLIDGGAGCGVGVGLGLRPSSWVRFPWSKEGFGGCSLRLCGGGISCSAISSHASGGLLEARGRRPHIAPVPIIFPQS